MSLDAASVLVLGQIVVLGIYLLGVAVDAGVACTVGLFVAPGAPRLVPRVVGSLGPLPLLNAVWLVVAGGLLVGGFPAADVEVLEEFGAVVLAGVTAAIVLLTTLTLHRVVRAAGLPLAPIAATAGAVLLVSVSVVTWTAGDSWRLTTLVGIVTQTLAAVAVGAAFCRARLAPAGPESLARMLQRASRVTVRLAAGSSACLALVSLRDGVDGPEPVVLAAATVLLLTASLAGTLRLATTALGYTALVGSQVAGSYDFLLRSSGDPATGQVLAVVVLALVPCLVLAQASTWWWVGRHRSAGAERGVW